MYEMVTWMDSYIIKKVYRKIGGIATMCIIVQRGLGVAKEFILLILPWPLTHMTMPLRCLEEDTSVAWMSELGECGRKSCVYFVSVSWGLWGKLFISLLYSLTRWSAFLCSHPGGWAVLEGGPIRLSLFLTLYCSTLESLIWMKSQEACLSGFSVLLMGLGNANK